MTNGLRPSALRVLRERIEPVLDRRQQTYGPYVPRELVRADASTDPFWTALRRRDAGDVPEVVSDARLGEMPWAVVTGSAGTGKSSVVTELVLQASRRYRAREGAPLPLWLDLEADGVDVHEALDAKYHGLAETCRESGSPVALYLDGLYDGMRQSRELRHRLQRLVQRLAPVQLVVGCRSIAWSDEWYDLLRPDAWPRDAVRPVYSVDRLERDAYAHLIPDRHSREAFFSRCGDLGVHDLLESVFSGFWLARRFAEGKPLPASRGACLREQVTERLTVRGGEASVSVERLREHAGLLATVGTFSDAGPWSERDVIDALGASATVREHVGPTEPEVKALLGTPLFDGASGRYAFSHQLLRESLAADVLSGVASRTLRGLVTVEVGHRDRVTPAHRPVAAMVAERRAEWWREMAELDPRSLLYAERSGEADTAGWIRAVVRDAVARNELPWAEVAPTGDRLWWLLAGHAPQDPAAVLRPWLRSQNALRRQWATACAFTWGGMVAVNGPLMRLALDDGEDTSSRQYAIKAIVATGSPQHLKALRPLARHQDDQVRGEAIRARMEEGAPALDVLGLFEGGPTEENLFGSLQRSAKEFGLGLKPDEVLPVVDALTTDASRFGKLRSHLLASVLSRAREVGLDGVPPAFVALIVGRGAYRGEMPHDIASWMRDTPQFWNRVFRWTCDQGDDDYGTAWSLAEVLTDGWVDGHAAELRAQASEAPDLLWFLSRIVRGIGQQDRSERRVRELRSLLGPLAVHLPPPREDEVPLSTGETERLFEEALSVGTRTPSERVRALMRATIATRTTRPDPDGFAEYEEVILGSEGVLRPGELAQALDGVGGEVRERVVAALSESADEASYPAWGEGESGTDADRIHWAVHALLHFGARVSTSVLERASASFGLWSSRPDLDPRRVVEALRDRDGAVWSRVVRALSIQSPEAERLVVEYLTDVGSPLLASESAQTLLGGGLDAWETDRHVRYLSDVRPEGWEDVLWDKSHRHGTADDASSDERWEELRPLLPLLAIGDARAWSELERRVSSDTAPTREETMTHRVRLNVPTAVGHETVLLDWYRRVRSGAHDSDDHEAHQLARALLSPVLATGTAEGLQRLRAFQRDRAFPGAEWLSFPIRELEDRLLDEAQSVVGTGELLDVVLRDSRRLIRDGRDLTEAVLSALEEIQAELTAGEGVGGFWNEPSAGRGRNTDYDPKVEEGCQGVLWPRLRAKLDAYGVRTVEERFVGPNRADLVVEVATTNGGTASVVIEAKVARAGYGPATLVRPVETQLTDQYLVPLGIEHGVFLVFWFTGEHYEGPKTWQTPAELSSALQTKAATLLTRGVRVAPMVLDVSGPWREQ